MKKLIIAAVLALLTSACSEPSPWDSSDTCAKDKACAEFVTDNAECREQYETGC